VLLARAGSGTAAADLDLAGTLTVHENRVGYEN
jgi:hypothetical protein